MLELTERRCKDAIAWQRCIAFSSSSKTRAKPITYEIMAWLSSSGRGVSFGGFSGEHAASEKSAEVLNDPMGI